MRSSNHSTEKNWNYYECVSVLQMQCTHACGKHACRSACLDGHPASTGSEDRWNDLVDQSRDSVQADCPFHVIATDAWTQERISHVSIREVGTA